MTGITSIKKSVYALVLCLYCLIFFVTPTQAAPVLQLDNNTQVIDVIPYTDHFITSQPIDINQVLNSATFYKFSPQKQHNFYFNWEAKQTWLRFSPQYTSKNNKQNRLFWLEIAPLHFSDMNVWIAEKNTTDEWQTKKLHEKNYKLTPAKLFPIELEPHKQVMILIQLSSNAPSILSLKLGDSSALAAERMAGERWLGISFGAFSILILISIIFAIICKRMSFAFLALYSLTIIVLLAWGRGYINTWHHTTNTLSWVVMALSFLSANSCLLLFCYLLKLNISLWLHLQKIIFFILLGCLPLLFILKGNQFFYLSLSIYCFISALLFIKSLACFISNRNMVGFYFFLSKVWIFFIIVALISPLNITMPMLSLDTPWFIPVLLWEIICLFIALFLNNKNIEENKLDQQKSLIIASTEARNRSEILGKISHQIRTPLSGILGMTELLRDTDLSKTQQEFNEIIYSSGQSLLNIIGQIIEEPNNTNQLDNEITQSWVNLNELIEECLQGFRQKSEEQNFEFICDISDTIPEVIQCDPSQIRQLLLQIISVAFYQRSSGDILLSIKSSNQTDSDIYIIDFSISCDSNEDQINDNATLHLSVIKQITKSIQGDCFSSFNKPIFNCGFTASFKSYNESIMSNDDSSLLKHSRLLVIDDNLNTCKVLTEQVKKWGVHASYKTNSKEALADIIAQDNISNAYDVILLDQKMPGMTGLDLAKKMQRHFDKNNSPLIIIITGAPSSITSQQAKAAGVSLVISKPVTGNNLRINLISALKKHQSNTIEDDETHKKTLSNKNILLAEDNPVSSQIISAMLKKLGTQVTCVQNGQQALEALRRKKYDLIFMDCEMPLMNGYEATRFLRRWEKESDRPHLTVVALTAHIMDEYKEKSFSAGMDDFLPKPVDMEKLKATLLKHLDK